MICHRSSLIRQSCRVHHCVFSTLLHNASFPLHTCFCLHSIILPSFHLVIIYFMSFLTFVFLSPPRAEDCLAVDMECHRNSLIRPSCHFERDFDRVLLQRQTLSIQFKYWEGSWHSLLKRLKWTLKFKLLYLLNYICYFNKICRIFGKYICYNSRGI